jgi:hypothetical protein
MEPRACVLVFIREEGDMGLVCGQDSVRTTEGRMSFPTVISQTSHHKPALTGWGPAYRLAEA